MGKLIKIAAAISGSAVIFAAGVGTGAVMVFYTVTKFGEMVTNETAVEVDETDED